MRVLLGGQPLVTGSAVAAVSSRDATVTVGGTPVAVASGRIGAHGTALSRTLPAYRATLDAMARALSADTELFVGDGAVGLRVADVAPLDVDDTWSQGALRPGSADGIFAALVGNVAATSAEAARRRQHREAVRGHLAELRTTMTAADPRTATHAHQQSFNTSSRVFTAVDGMLDALLGHVGAAAGHTRNRITAAGATAQSLAAVQSASARLSSLQHQLATGRRITTSSDDPDGTVTAMALRSSLARNEHYAAACDDALVRLDEFEALCEQVGSAVQRTRALVGRVLGAGSRDDAAALVDDVRTTLAEAAAHRPPPVTRTIAARTVVDLGALDRALFGENATSISAQLRKISSLLRSAPESLSTSALDRLDAVIARIDAVSNDAARGREQVQRLTTARVASDLALRTRLADIEDVDLADVAVRTATANAAYQASLRTIAQADRPSLHDFLH